MKVLIIGRGITGSVLYHLFKRAGHSVIVIESGFRKFYPTLIHSLLLKDKDIELAIESKKIYKDFNVLMVSYPSYTIGKVSRKMVDEWLSYSLNVKEKFVDWLNTYAIVGEGTDSLVYIKKLIDSVPFIKGVAKIEKGKVFVNEKEINADIVILSAGAWNSYFVDIKLPLKSYYCWAWVTTNRNPLLDKTIIYDYELGYYSRPLFGLGMSLNIVGDGDTIPSSPFVKQNGDLKAVERAKKRLGELKPVIRGESYCEGTPDMRPLYGRIMDNIYIIGGLNGYGAEVGPGLAKLLFEFITNGKEEKEYMIDRFGYVEDFELGKEPHEL
mgnify:CR=1 FL=1